MPSLETQSIWHFQLPVCVSFLFCVVLLFCRNKWIEAHTKRYHHHPPTHTPFVPCPWRCREYISKAASVLYLATACYFWLHFSSVQDDIYVLGIAHMRSAPSLRRFPSVAFETVLVLLSLTGWFDWLMITYIALFSALLSRLTALACGSTWVTSFL